MDNAERLKNLPSYLFAEIDKMIVKAKKEGVDVISFGIGDPDQATPDNVVNKMIEAVKDHSTHSYPTYEGLYEFRETISEWYKERFNIKLDPDKEVVALIGSKEGIAHLPFCYLNSGDLALIPDPAYPVYNTAVLLAGGKSVKIPLIEENNYLPDLNGIDEDTAKAAKLFFINYPNNPTGAIANEKFYRDIIDFAKKYNIYIIHDAAYSEIGLDGHKALSFMEIEGAKDVGIEFNSLSKPFNMTGWRIGWAVGNKDIIESLARIKSNIDSGVFEAVQYAGIEALKGPKDNIDKMIRLYTKRRNLLIEGFNKLGWKLQKNKATFYIWAKVPKRFTSKEFSEYIFKETGIFFTPGNGYGNYGEGYVRIALTVDEERIKEALQRLENKNINFN
jgi:LL-diaminopimelate aminotransferase